MQSLFQDKETFVEFADSLKKKNKVLWNKFKQAIRKFLDKLDTALKGFAGEKAEGFAGEAVQNALAKERDQIRKLFVEAFEGANANFEEAVMRNNGKAANTDTRAASSESVRDVFGDKSIYDYGNYSSSDFYTNARIYSYDFLVAQKDMTAVKLPDTGMLTDNKGKIDINEIVRLGKKNALLEGEERGGKIYVKNTYTGRELRVDNSTIRHGLDGTYRRLLTNARIGSVIGTVVKNAIPINGLKNTSPNAVGTYAMVSYCNDSQNREFIAVVVVEQQSGAIDSFELFDVAHAVSGRQKNSSQVDTKSQGVNPIKATTISIADLLNIVNSTHQSILSDNVLSQLGEIRAENGSFADKVLFSDRVTNPTEKEVDGKVPRANRASLIKTSTSDRSISQSVTTVNTNISEKSKNSTEKYSDRDYSYDNLVSTPDMKVTQIGTEAPSNRADIVFEAKRNASKIGKFNVKDGSVSVYVDDIGTDVVIGKKGLLHGLQRGKELSTKATVTVKIGEILKNSIKVNEATPKDSAADRTYVLIGCATDNINTYVVRSIINTFSSELQSVDVLYAVNTKKETAVSETPRVSTPSTVSTVSITDLLDYVNRCFPEVLSADVLKHFGHESRPEGNPKGSGESMLYSDRDGIVKDATQLTEGDLRYLLEQIQEGELDTGYIPVARTTPQFYIDVVNEHSKGKTEVMKVPLASSVEHMMQNMEEYDGSTYEDDKTPHGLSTDDIITISKEMIHPKYIVLQRNGRYAEVVSFFSEKRKKQVVLSIDFAEDGEIPKNFKHEQYMNGYNGGYYNIIVTEYEPTDLKSYLKNNEIVYDRQRMNGKYQVGSGRIVTVTHDTPFIQKDNTTVSDKSQEEALDKKQSKKKNLKDIEPTNYLNPNRIIPVNNITDKEKYEYLVSEFDKNGYSGRPVVVVTEDGFADDSSSMYSAVTGSHRILAATEAEIDVPVYEIHMKDENAERIMELVDANEDSERARIAKELFEDGIISEEAYSLIEREDELNYENDDVSYSEQLRYSDRDEGLKDFVEKRKNSILSEYGIDRIGDYVQVQKRVYQGLREKGFFTNEEKTSIKDVNEASGMIVYTNRKGINETFNYGNFAKSSNALKLLKILTVEKIPELIQNGQLIDDNVENFHGLKNEFAYISGKVNIDGLDINMWLAIKKTEAKNRFWVHYVGIKSDIDETTSTGSSNSRMAFRNTNVANGDYTISKLKSQEEAFDKLYSDRDITLSSRYLLANALESTARNEVERDWLGRYKADIEKYNAEQDKLTTLNAQIKELSFGKGKRDMAKLRQLRDEKIKTENRINIYDKRLLRIETAKPLQNVIEREKTKTKNKALQQGREALEAYKKTAAQKLREEVALRKEPFCRPRLFKF